MYRIKVLPSSARSNPPKKAKEILNSPVAEITPEAGKKLSRYVGVQSENHGFSGEIYDQIDEAAKKVYENTVKAGKFHLRGEPALPFQLAGMLFALHRNGRAGIFDPMGLGKTTTALLTLAAGDAKQRSPTDTNEYVPALVVCPKSAVPSWENEIKKRTRYTVTVVNQANDLKDIVKEAGKMNVFVVSYETLRKLLEPARTPDKIEEPSYYKHFSKKDRKSEFASSIDEMEDDAGSDEERTSKKVFTEAQVADSTYVLRLLKDKIKTLIFDEAHRLKNYGSANTRVCYYLANFIPHVLVLTGTPMLNDPGELASILSMVSPMGEVPYYDYPISDAQIAKSLESIFLEKTTGLTMEQLTASRTGHITFKNWEDENPQKLLQEELYKKGTRHPRRLAVETGAFGRFSLREKDRFYAIVPPSEARVAEALAAIERTQEVIGSTKTKRFVEGSDKSDFAKKIQTVSGFVFKEIDDIYRNSPNMTVQEAVDPRAVEFLKKELYKGYIPIPTSLMQGMGISVIDTTVQYLKNRINGTQAGRERPTILFAYHKRVVSILFAKLREAYPNIRIYVADASKVSMSEPGSTTLNPVKGDFAELTNRFRYPNKLAKEDERAVIILTRAGTEGLNLSAADLLIFLQRMPNPGVEAQAEDRINRPEQNVNPKIVYMLPSDPFSLALMSRIERKRNHTRLILGESPTDDYSTEPKMLVPVARILADMPQPFKDLIENKDGTNVLLRDYLMALIAELMPKEVLALRYAAIQKELKAKKATAKKNPIELYDPHEEQIRRIRLAIYKSELAKGTDAETAKKKAFQIAGRTRSHRFLEPGTNTPTAESRERAVQKLLEDPEKARQRRAEYEAFLAVGRKSGPRRVVAERENIFSGPIVYRVMPEGFTYDTEEKARQAMNTLNLSE